MIGLMYQHTRSKFLGTLSFFTESDAMKMTSDKLGNQGVGMMTRLVYKPFCEPGKIFHVGLSGAFETPRYSSDKELSHHSYTLSTTFPTRIAKVVAQEAVIDDAKMLYKFTPELTAAIGRVGLETQYFYVNVNRKDKPCYKASGAYGTIRALVKVRIISMPTWMVVLQLLIRVLWRLFFRTTIRICPIIRLRYWEVD